MKDKDKDPCWLQTCSGLAFAGYAVIYFAFIGIGGVVFMAIEGENASPEEGPSSLQIVKTNFIKKFPSISGEQLDNFLVELSAYGLANFQAMNTTGPKWTYSESVFFCVTLLTTVGYGHIAPVSPYGKAFSMIYTSLGIPLTILFVAACVQRMTTKAETLQRNMSICLERFRFKPMTIRFLFFLVAFMSVGLFFFIIPAELFIYLEDNWTYLDAFYFCFISLTTVGLGDYVPGKKANVKYISIYRLGVSLYLLLGVIALAYLMALVNKCLEIIILNSTGNEKQPLEPLSSGPPSYESTSVEPQFPSYGSIAEEKLPLIAKPKQYEIYQISAID